jgi:hypothetical protein
LVACARSDLVPRGRGVRLVGASENQASASKGKRNPVGVGAAHWRGAEAPRWRLRETRTMGRYAKQRACGPDCQCAGCEAERDVAPWERVVLLFGLCCAMCWPRTTAALLAAVKRIRRGGRWRHDGG